MARKTGPAIFADLDNAERNVLWAKLTAGVSMAQAVGDHATASDIAIVNLDVTAPWAKQDRT